MTIAKFSPNGRFLAYATGNDWSGGIGTLGKFEARVYVHNMLDEDVVKR